MILQALNDYYWRKQEVDPGALPTQGFEVKAIPFALVLDESGKLVQIADRREGEGKARVAKQALVPQAVKRASGIAANLLWDNVVYALGIDGSAEDHSESSFRAAEKHAAFRERLHDAFGDSFDDPGVRAVASFLDSSPADSLEVLEAFPQWSEILKTNPFVSFQLRGDVHLVCERKRVVDALLSAVPDETRSRRGFCLVTGENDAIERLHSAIKGVWGATTSGANIVSVNNKNESGSNGGATPAFASYGKQQGYNSPVGKQAVFAYTTALNHLLAKGSRQRVQVGDASTVFWAERESGAEFEEAVYDFFKPQRKGPDDGSQAVASLYRSVADGRLLTDDADQRFYVLGLAPNAARLSIRFWHVKTIAELSRAFQRYFNDVEIVRPEWALGAPLGLFALLIATAAQGKADNIVPSLGGEVMRAILTGADYPAGLLQGTLRRVRADHDISWQRAAILKAWLVRNQHDQEITVSLNNENLDPGYRLGRLFAVLERTQERAQGNLNASIRERYYGAFSATPVTVLPLLMKLKNHHLAKLQNRGEAVNLEKQFGIIMDGLQDIPARLSLAEQARFAVGYYHQRQAFFAGSGAENTTDSVDQRN